MHIVRNLTEPSNEKVDETQQEFILIVFVTDLWGLNRPPRVTGGPSSLEDGP